MIFVNVGLVGKNLDLIIFLINNWHDNSTISFEDWIELVDLYGFGEVEEDILDILNFEFLCEVQGHLEDSSKIGTCICDFGVVLFMMHMVPIYFCLNFDLYVCINTF